MTTTIHLDELLQAVVTIPSRNLVTRSTGMAVRERVLHYLRDHAGSARLDFSRVGVMDFSCADEVVAKLLALLEELPLSGLALIGLRPDHADAIDLALARQGLSVVAWVGEAPRPAVLGDAAADACEVVVVLEALHTASSATVADQLAWPVARAEQALATLIRCRGARRLPDASFALGVSA